MANERPTCPACGSVNVYSPNTNDDWRCNRCGFRHFTGVESDNKGPRTPEEVFREIERRGLRTPNIPETRPLWLWIVGIIIVAVIVCRWYFF